MDFTFWPTGTLHRREGKFSGGSHSGGSALGYVKGGEKSNREELRIQRQLVVMEHSGRQIKFRKNQGEHSRNLVNGAWGRRLQPKKVVFGLTLLLRICSSLPKVRITSDITVSDKKDVDRKDNHLFDPYMWGTFPALVQTLLDQGLLLQRISGAGHITDEFLKKDEIFS
jgi:hypothetical protein